MLKLTMWDRVACCAPDIPEPPSPQETASASNSTNISTAVANAYLGNVNQVTPNGSLSYDQTGSKDLYDAYTDKTYNIPTFTATQTLSPGAQAIQDQNDKTKLNLATFGSTQSGRLNSLLSKPFSLSGLPAAGQAGNYSKFNSGPSLATGFGDAGRINMDFANTFGDAGDITRTYGTDFSADRQKVEDALMARLQPQIDRDREAMRTQMANSGIGIGSEAYGAAQDDLNRGINDARLGAILAGGQEQSRLVGLEAGRAGFENSAQAQAYQQLFGRAQFGNQALEAENAAQAQNYGQIAQRAQFSNDALQQMFNNYFGANQANNALASRTFDEQNVLRQGALQEKFAERSQPLNELIAVLSGTQLQQPNFVNTNISPIPTTDVAGLINTNYQQQLAKAQAEDQNILGGLFGLGSAGIFKWSDERLKEDIRRVGETDDGLGIYFYRYKGDPTPQMGLMAHEVEKRHPAAVIDIGGYKAVNYDMIFRAVEA